MGGVAGAMDQADSNTMTRLPSGQYGYMPSRRHLDKMQQMMQPNLQSTRWEAPVYRQPIMQAQTEEDKMDVSKYLGKNKLQQQKPQPNSQLELLKTVLAPISDQLEKICILLGMIYQKLDGAEVEQEYAEPVSGLEIDSREGEDMAPEEQIAVLERAMSNRPKAPTTEELGEIDDDPQIDM